MAEIIAFPLPKRSTHVTKSRSQSKKAGKAPTNVPPPKRKRWSVDIISERPVNGLILIEGCVPILAYEALMAFLGAS